jgi:hypothetical protein
MKNKKQDKKLERLLFEVYEKGVKQQDCNLTEYIEKVKQVLRIHHVIKLVCDVCGSDDVIEVPHMGKNCNRCHPL